MKKIIYLTAYSILISNASVAQLFIDDGTDGAIYIRNASGGTLAASEATSTDVALYVDGNITIEGTYDNQAAETQLTGNFSNSGTFTTTGDEVFESNSVQSISGTATGTNDFYNLILNNTLLNLASNIEIDNAGKLIFEQGVLNASNNYIRVKNTLIGSIVGAGSNGALNKLIIGELRRDIVAGSTYEFAVGDAYIDAGGGDGVQYASLKSNNGNGVVSVIFHDSTGIGVTSGIVICPSGTGGHQDVEYRIRNGAWVITNPGGGISDYDVTLNPIDYTDNGYIDYTILKDGLATGRDLCDGVASLPPITHDSLTSFSTFEVAASTSTTLLPIELIYFTATAVNDKEVKLNWETASEINNDYFTVERSLNGTEWEELIKIEGAGNSSSPLSYSSMDNSPYFGLSYYRLKQTDFDGQFSYSAIRAVNINRLNKSSSVSIYPNPTSKEITIQGDKSELSTINIYNLIGQDITNIMRIETVNIGLVKIDMTNLSSGIYYVKTKTTSNKLFKQ